MASVTVRPSLDNPESNVNIDKANEIIQRLQSAKLYTSTLQSNFEQKVAEFEGSDPKSAISARRHPAEIAGDVAAQVSFLRTLKFQYLEQNAKDKYIKTIVDDEAPLITIDDNESLRETNEQRKAELKAAKEKLAAKYGNIKSLASEVEEKHRLANTLATSLASLTSQILDARLALSRLRNQHPPPRLSLATAEATLEAQTDAMASLDHALANMNDKLEDTKNELGEKAREVERLKMERAAVEKELEEGERGRDGGEEDGRVVGLYDWYSASLALHHALFSLHSKETVSENELRLTYHFESPTNTSVVVFTITLLFHPNTRHLADASLSSSESRLAELDLQDLVGSHVQCNDVAGLIKGIHARVRAVIN